MSDAFSDTAFGKNTAFSDDAFAFGTAAPVSAGGHFGGRRRKHREEDVSHSLENRNALRRAIRTAIDGPEHVSEAVAEALEPFARAQKTDARLVPLDERIDWGMLDSRFAEIDRILSAAIRQAEEDDDDEDWLLLNG